MTPQPAGPCVIMKAGPHTGEDLDAIIARKQEEAASAGWCLWGYGGSACHPLTQVQPQAESAAPRPVPVCSSRPHRRPQSTRPEHPSTPPTPASGCRSPKDTASRGRSGHSSCPRAPPSAGPPAHAAPARSPAETITAARELAAAFLRAAPGGRNGVELHPDDAARVLAAVTAGNAPAAPRTGQVSEPALDP